ncbi:hypothetical protein N9N67_09025 [Bacteriovoracaceae bacterium]|nr:hypothetical protein [Bacteriovoracaceae bacterium]
MKFIKLLILANLLLTLSIFGQENEIKLMGQETGNGGDIVHCKDNIKQNKILDVYEAEDIYEWDLSHFNNIPSLEVAEIIFLKRLDEVYPELTTILLEEFILFRKESKYPMNIEMRDIPDSKHPGVPEGCELKQIAYQRTPNVEGIPRYIISKSLYETLDIKNKFALMLHEVLYKMAINKKKSHQDSTKVRDLTAKLLSTGLSNFSYLEMVRLLSNLNISHPDLTFKFKDFSLFHDSLILGKEPNFPIQKATIFRSPKIDLKILGNDYSFSPRKVYFDKNENIKSYVIIEENNYLRINGSLKVIYDGEKPYITQITGVTGHISFGQSNFILLSSLGTIIDFHLDATGNVYFKNIQEESVFYHPKYGKIRMKGKTMFDYNNQLTGTVLDLDKESKIFPLKQSISCESGPIEFLLLTYDLHSCILSKDQILYDKDGAPHAFQATDEANFDYDGYVNKESSIEIGRKITLNKQE